PRASFAVHHGPVGLAASPHALTRPGSKCAACPGRSETSGLTTYASGRAEDRSAIAAAMTAAATAATTGALRGTARRRSRRANDERRRELHAQRLDALALEEPHQEADACASELLQRLPDCRQLRPHDARLECVVEADERHVFGNAQAEAPCSVQ